MSRLFAPRPSQERILAYAQGRLGISAVPGSGKTHTLSALAAKLIASGRLKADQEVLVVTLVNSAVDNFTSRIESLTEPQDLASRFGYRVRTLHGLAHDIVRENPALVGLDKQFTIIDETASAALMRDAVVHWTRLHDDVRDSYVKKDLVEPSRQQVIRRHWPELIETIAANFIKSAKDQRISPEALRRELERRASPLALAEMGSEIYRLYHNALIYRGAVDFDDLIRLAADMLSSSNELVERLRHRWPFILEDEAQDSSRLQQEILSALAGPDGNWVRVGDPNQAIYETFTTAEPRLLREFIQANLDIPMPESGRCQPSIMAVANYLIAWTMHQHPVPELRDALSPPPIQSTPPDDPQPNPPDNPSAIAFVDRKYTAAEEVSAVASSLRAWLPGHSDATVAVLSSTNDHATSMVKELQSRGIECLELLKSTSPTRLVAGTLSQVMDYLVEPGSAPKLAGAYQAWRRGWSADQSRLPLYHRAVGTLARLKDIAGFIAPAPPSDQLHSDDAPDTPGESLVEDLTEPEQGELLIELKAFRAIVIRWQGATVLPVDQLILTLAQDLFTAAADIALAYKLALVMGQLADADRRARLPDFVPQLNDIAMNERKFIGFSSAELGFDPDSHKGKVVVSTIHKAKGLEWDRVYLMSVNNYDFPSAAPNDRFVSEKWFLRDQLNLEAETLAQLKAALAQSGCESYQEGLATRRARLDYARERLRLLYVGLTRARKELLVTWNTGRRGEATPAVAFAALQGWWSSIGKGGSR